MGALSLGEFVERSKKGLLGDLTISRSDGLTLCGPIKEVRKEGSRVVFETIWTAARNGANEAWQIMPNVDLIMEASATAESYNDGSFIFHAPGAGKAWVFQKHGLNLDPSDVYGLSNDQLRQSRAWLYDLPLDSSWSQIINRVVHDLGADRLTSAEEQVQVQREAAEAH